MNGDNRKDHTCGNNSESCHIGGNKEGNHPCGGIGLPSLVMVFVALLLISGCRLSGSESAITKHGESNMDKREDVLMPTDVAQMVSLINANGVTADFIEVGPWYNRMPGTSDQDGADNQKKNEGRNRHLVATVVLRNANDRNVQIALEQAFISFENDLVGGAVKPGALSIMDESGMPSGKLSITLPANEPKQLLRFRGWGLYGPGHENQTLYLTLLLKIGDHYVTIRRSGKVVVAL